ncbi:transcription factor E2F wHTH [Cryptosporidium ryanae]|uniref:transcription factor E2F wHTH n=1 Tax=Cryptosporidium ryanae TaxID=515981 RepID=UPI003519FF2E|nr:transcription factor E2F wHTH [Cryptosporidium ryanae]
MLGSSSTSTSGNAGDVVTTVSSELLNESTNSNNQNAGTGTNSQDVLSLLSYLVPNSGNDNSNSSVNPPPPQIADQVTINELLGLINGSVTNNPTAIKTNVAGNSSDSNNNIEPLNVVGTSGATSATTNSGSMSGSIPYILPLLMGSGSTNDQNITLLNSLVSSSGPSPGQQGNINQFVSQLQNLIPPLVPGPGASGMQNSQNLSHTTTGANHSAEHLQMIYGGNASIGADNKSELLAAAAAFAASNSNQMNVSGGPITNSRGRARKRVSSTPMGSVRGRRDSVDGKRRSGSPGRHNTMDTASLGPSGTILPHIPSLADGIETIEHANGVNMIGTPAAHHNGSQFNEFSTEDARHSVRFENGLVLMTKRFIQYLYEQGESRIIDLAAAEAHMDVQRRRLYDITNVLEGIGILKKMGRNAFMCSASVPDVLVERDAVLSSFGTVDMSVKLTQNTDDEALNSIPWFNSYNKLQVLSNSEYEVMEKTLIQRKDQLLQACQQLGFNDIVEQYTIANNGPNSHSSGSVGNFASGHQGRPQNNNSSNIHNPTVGQHSNITLTSHSNHNIRDESISVPSAIERQAVETNEDSSGSSALWGSIINNAPNRPSNVPSIHHPDARWMEATETSNNASKHGNGPGGNDQGSNSSGTGDQNESVNDFNE